MATKLPHLSHPKYRPDIDGLRAVAVLAVIGFHAFPSLMKGGFIGVDVFFVISGFLISTIIFESLERGSFSYLEFYSRRIKRIFPALLLVLIATYSFGWFTLLADEYKQLGKHLAAGASFISNFVLWREAGYFDNSAETKPLLHLWSLGIEEQFYIVWPVLLWVASKRKFNLFALTLTVALISYYLNLKGIREDSIATFFSPLTRFWELLCGGMLAWFSLNRSSSFAEIKSQSEKWVFNILSLIGCVLLVYGFLWISKTTSFPGNWAFVPVLGAVLIIGSGSEAWINQKILSNKIVVWFGLISFPLYLWHWPLLTFARIIEGQPPSRDIRFCAVLLSIFLAWLTYALIERPIRLATQIKFKVVVPVLLLIAVGCIGFGTYKRDGLLFRNIVKLNSIEKRVLVSDGLPAMPCDQIVGLDGKWCSIYKSNKTIPNKKILIWGDSSVRSFLPVFKDLAINQNFTLVSVSHPSCPPILGARKTDFLFPESKSYCSTGLMQEGVIDFISKEKPDLIVLISAWNSYSPFSNREFVTITSSGPADPASTSEAIKVNLPKTISRLSTISNVLVFKSWPFLHSPPNYQTKRLSVWKGSDKTGATTSRYFHDDSFFVNEVLDGLKISNVIFYNPAAKVCDDRNCSIVLNGKQLYADNYHISLQGSFEFRDDILNSINTCLRNNLRNG